MIIDFRVRPPFKSYNGLGLGHYLADMSRPKRQQHAFQFMREPNPSFDNGDIEMFVKEMDEAHIDMACVIGRNNGQGGPNGGSMNMDDTHELAQLYPGRFIPFCPLANDDLGEPVLRKALSLGMKGFVLETIPYHVNDPRFNDVYDFASQHDMVVAITLSMYCGSVCNPYEVFEICMRFPRVKFVIPHAGWPFTNEMLGVALCCHNLYLSPDFYAGIPSMPGWKDWVEAANGCLRYQILFATSYPVRTLSQGLREWYALPFAPDVRELVMHENAEYVLGMRND